jgi:hypothetical protein
MGCCFAIWNADGGSDHSKFIVPRCTSRTAQVAVPRGVNERRILTIRRELRKGDCSVMFGKRRSASHSACYFGKCLARHHLVNSLFFPVNLAQRSGPVIAAALPQRKTVLREDISPQSRFRDAATGAEPARVWASNEIDPYYRSADRREPTNRLGCINQ